MKGVEMKGRKGERQAVPMRFGQILLVFCVVANLYQSRFLFLQFVEICLGTIVWLSFDAHRYIQEHWSSSREISRCHNQTLDHYNLSNYEHQCPNHPYTIRIIERRPLIIYIEQFLTEDEIEHVLELANRNFVHSSVVQEDGSSFVDNNYRSSSTAYLQRSQTSIVKCLEQRFAHFQGNIDPSRIEPLQVVKYDSHQEFKPHVDWFHHSEHLSNGGQRITTFFTYLQANCSMGETEFHNIKFDFRTHSQYCHILRCDQSSIEHGIRFRPIPGNSIFWYNVDEQGRPDNDSFHAGLPPGDKGQKFGLNTWTRERMFVFPQLRQT